MSRRESFQFSVRWLFVVTTLVSVVAAIMSRLQGPQVARAIIGAYFIVWSAYLAVKLKRTLRVLTSTRDRLERIELQRRTAWVRSRFAVPKTPCFCRVNCLLKVRLQFLCCLPFSGSWGEVPIFCVNVRRA